MKKRALTVVLLLVFCLSVTGCYDFGLMKHKESGASNKETKKKEKVTQKKKNKKKVTDADYTVGIIVTVKGEKFYVLEDSDKDDSEVVLFAVYNLKKDGSKQHVDATVEETKVDFSAEAYWLDRADSFYEDWTSVEDHDNGKSYFDLNEENGNKSGDAITKARNYATSLGGKDGRLLTYEEADELRKDYPDMIGGHENNAGSTNYLNYYLSSVRYYGHDKVFTYRGQGDSGGEICSYADTNYGVRPVITVSKSLINK